MYDILDVHPIHDVASRRCANAKERFHPTPLVFFLQHQCTGPPRRSLPEIASYICIKIIYIYIDLMIMLQYYNTDYLLPVIYVLYILYVPGRIPTTSNATGGSQDYLEDTIGGPVTWELRPEEDYGALDRGKWGEMSGIFFVGISLGTYIYIYLILYYIILYYIILYYIILYYIYILYYIISYYIILHYFILFYLILYYTILYYITLVYIILSYLILYYIIYYILLLLFFFYIIFYYIILSYIILSYLILYYSSFYFILFYSILLYIYDIIYI